MSLLQLPQENGSRIQVQNESNLLGWLVWQGFWPTLIAGPVATMQRLGPAGHFAYPEPARQAHYTWKVLPS